MKKKRHNKKKPNSKLWGRLQEATPGMREDERSPYFEEICEVAQPTVSRWRTGTTGLNPTHAGAISLKTGFCRQYLTDGNGPTRWNVKPADELELAEILDGKTERGRAEILRFARFHDQDSTDNGDNTPQA